MDLLPFHLAMLAVDLALLWMLYLWPKKRLWLLSGLVILFCVVVFSKIFENHRMQQCIEGLCWHWTAYMIGAGIIMFLKKKKAPAIVSWCVAVPILLLGVDLILYEPYALKVVHYRIESPKITRPYKIAFISDIQTDTIGSYERRTFRLLKEQDADLILFGGDYAQTFSRTPLAQNFAAQYNQMIKAAALNPPLGAFAVPGDTDQVSGTEIFEGTGVRFVADTKIFHLNDELDLSIFNFPDRDRPIRRSPEDMKKFHIMLSHRPDYALGDRASGKDKYAPDLMLAGHTHGGQICIPYYGPLYSNTEGLPRSWMSGMRKLPSGSRLLITSGTGMELAWAPRIRFNCRPEISVVELVPIDE